MFLFKSVPFLLIEVTFEAREHVSMCVCVYSCMHLCACEMFQFRLVNVTDNYDIYILVLCTCCCITEIMIP